MTLAHIDGEALAVPGLRIWGNRLDHVFAIIAQDDRGATELWFDEQRNDGGIELHSPRDWGRFGAGAGPMHEPCAILGGPCWSDGSLIAWTRDFAPLVAARESVAVLRQLVHWHEAHFGTAEARP